jgi:methyl-accepting chemotaxis protein
MAEQPTYRRRKKLIKPRLQLKLTMIFVGLSALSLLLQFVLFQNTLATAALELPHDSIVLMEASTGMLLRVLAMSFLVFLPLTFMVGILTTFRIAGPVYRFEQFLDAVRAGKCPPNFRLRKGDELTDLATLLNEATEPLRQDASPESGPEDVEGPASLVDRESPEAAERETHPEA